MLHWRKKRQQVKKLPETKTLNNLSLAEKLEHIPLEITTQKINNIKINMVIPVKYPHLSDLFSILEVLVGIKGGNANL